MVTHAGVNTQTQVTAIDTGTGVATVSVAVPSVTHGDTWTLPLSAPQAQVADNAIAVWTNTTRTLTGSGGSDRPHGRHEPRTDCLRSRGA